MGGLIAIMVLQIVFLKEQMFTSVLGKRQSACFISQWKPYVTCLYNGGIINTEGGFNPENAVNSTLRDNG